MITVPRQRHRPQLKGAPVVRIVKSAMRYLLAAFFVAGGIYHFVNPAFYVRIMPDYLPLHLFLVYLSGVCEVVLGAALLVPSLAPRAAWGLILLLIAVFPANIHMAMHPDRYPEMPLFALWARLPLQGVLIAWAYWFTRPDQAVPDDIAELRVG
jgi:uncharacterized membrane protein